jgi:arylsulfatase A-like enzyme/Flp pilus assembly protein TadD
VVVLRSLAACALLLALACDGAQRPERVGRTAAHGPSLLLVTIDTLRADHVGAWGATDAQTPTLDGLAAEGVRFAHAIAPAPLTLPSHTTILTGLHPPSHGVRHNGLYQLGAEATTLAERARDAGYATAGFVSSFILSRLYGLDQGFALYDDEMTVTGSGRAEYQRGAEVVTDRALAWLREAPEPFFAWVHYYDPHAAYAPPAPWAEKFAGRPYAGEIAYVDAQLGRLVEALHQDGRLSRTVIAVTSDHGESLGEHAEDDHSYTLYDAVLAVPLLLRGPGLPAGRVVEPVVGLVDLAPTLTALLGLPALAPVDGEDLAPLWKDGAAAPSRVAYAETLATQLDLGWSPLHAARSADHLYVRAPRPELYAVASDPKQLDDLMVSEPDAARESAARLDAEIASVLERSQTRQPLALDEHTLEGLRALGYALTGEPVEGTGLDPKDGMPALRDLNSAQKAYENGESARARELLTGVLGRMPASGRAHALLGFLDLQTGDPEGAAGHLERAVELAPRAAQYRAMLGEARTLSGRESEGLAAYRAAVEIEPTEPTARLGLARERIQAGDLEGAERHARLAVEGDPLGGMVPARMGILFETHGHPDRALAAYEAAVKAQPDLAVARMLLAVQLARRGDAPGAERERAQAGHLATDPALLLRLARAHLAAGDTARGEALLSEILARNPGFEPAARTLASLRR